MHSVPSPLLFAYGTNRFCNDAAYVINKTLRWLVCGFRRLLRMSDQYGTLKLLRFVVARMDSKVDLPRHKGHGENHGHKHSTYRR